MILPDFDSQERCCYYSAQPVMSDVCEISRDYFNKDFSKNYKLDFNLKIVNYFLINIRWKNIKDVRVV